MAFNTSIVHSSLKYLKTFNLVIKLSRWIYEELIKINYNDSKLKKALKIEDFEIVKESGLRPRGRSPHNIFEYR
jgi:hypothetical protein